jgi:hypothetical protein
LKFAHFSLALVIVLTLAALNMTGCSSRPLLYDVEFYPDVISPNADGHDDAANILYKLSRNASLSIYVIDQTGERHYHRNGERRSAQNEPYWTLFSGVVDVDEGGPVKRRVLPDGQYTWVIEATDDSGYIEKAEGSLTIVDAARTVPELRGFSVSPQVFSPNRDGVDDHVTINYFLPVTATVRVYLLSEAGEKVFLPEKVSQRIKPREVGLHQYDYEGGVDLGAVPPPDGTYTVTAIAEDILGQQVEEQSTLTIQHGGVPRADIINAEVEYSTDEGLWGDFTSLTIPLSGTLYFTATVQNYGDTPVRTTGPQPGTFYTSRQNFSTLEWYQSDGAWRFGLDFEENPGQTYPFRWSLGRHDELQPVVKGDDVFYYLMPGQRVTITGAIRILDEPPRNPFYLWAGLIHEGVEIVQNRVDPVSITIDAPSQGAWNQ